MSFWPHLLKSKLYVIMLFLLYHKLWCIKIKPLIHFILYSTYAPNPQGVDEPVPSSYGGLSAKFCTTSTLNQLMIWFWEDVILTTFAKVKIICYNVVFALSQTMMYKNKTINSFHIIQHIRSKPPGCRWAGAKQLWHRLRRSWASARISSAAPGRWPHTWSGEEKNKKEFGLRALRLSILAALFAPFVNFRLFGPCRHCIMSCACVSIVIVFSQEKVMHLTTHDGQV